MVLALLPVPQLVAPLGLLLAVLPVQVLLQLAVVLELLLVWLQALHQPLVLLLMVLRQLLVVAAAAAAVGRLAVCCSWQVVGWLHRFAVHCVTACYRVCPAPLCCALCNVVLRCVCAGGCFSVCLWVFVFGDFALLVWKRSFTPNKKNKAMCHKEHQCPQNASSPTRSRIHPSFVAS